LSDSELFANHAKPEFRGIEVDHSVKLGLVQNSASADELKLIQPASLWKGLK